MTNVCRIPDKFETVEIITTTNFVLDTKGLCCEIFPRGGSITVSLPENSGSILLKEDERFNFCGKIVCHHSSGTVSIDCFYYHTL